MSVRIDRRQFLKAAAITSGAIGVGVAWPRGVHQPSAHAGSVNDCLVGGNSNFISTEVPNLGQTLSVERIYKRWGEELFTADVVASAAAELLTRVELGRPIRLLGVRAEFPPE